MKIITLSSENVKRLKAVQIKPDGSLVVIGGKNGAGKTSVLDSIQYALGGGKSLPAMPVRQGEEHAEIVVDLGEIVVTRTFSATGGSALVVKSKEGLKYPSPQSVLDKLVGRLSFDPLEFARASGPEQADTLRALVGVDVSGYERTAQIAYDNRTVVARQVKQIQGQLAAMPAMVRDIPEIESSTADVLEQQEKAGLWNNKCGQLYMQAEAKQRDYARAEEQVQFAHAEVVRAKAALKKSEAALQAAEQARAESSKAAEEARKASDLAKPIDMAPFKTKLAEVERTNSQIQANARRRNVEELLAKTLTEQMALTSQIEAAQKCKRDALAAAKYPIEGLALNELGAVTLKGIPFEQCSSAEQLRVSVAIGLALNPTLRVLLIRDGSLLDKDNLKLVAEMAAKADAQVWIECVGDNGMVSVIIEDGSVSAEAINPPKE